MTPPPSRILRLPEVIARVNLGKSSIYSLIKAGGFPQPLRLGRASGWLEHEIEDWIQARAAERPQN
jgi:prophage regulatory protein